MISYNITISLTSPKSDITFQLPFNLSTNENTSIWLIPNPQKASLKLSQWEGFKVTNVGKYLLIFYWQGKVESSESIISTFPHPPELRAIRKKKWNARGHNKRSNISHTCRYSPSQKHTQIRDSHRLYTFGFQPFSSTSAHLAFSPASRTSLSILSFALKILLCK